MTHTSQARCAREARIAGLVSGALLLVVLWAGAALAHKVNVFAVLEGGAVSGEGYFSGGAKAQNVPVEILDASGAVVAQGVTEKDGTFKIPLPASVSPPLKIVLKAGDGHQNDFTLTAQDLAPAVPVSAPASAAQAPGTAPASPATVSPAAASGQKQGAAPASAPSAPPATGSSPAIAPAAGSPAVPPLDEARLATLIEAAVSKAVDEKFAPLKLQLARMAEQDQSARMRDIIGGIGWIVGLVGIAAWFKRPRK